MSVRKAKLVRPRPLQARSLADGYLTAFVEYVSGECRLAENTVAAYRRDIRRFTEWLAGRRIAELSIRDLADYAGWLYGMKLAPPSIARHLVSVKV
ncbi:MAG: site-specific integrase, partial [Patescibacteria group bacterium]|nr:site-specific integrase [Patescibacteria group bacterium]